MSDPVVAFEGLVAQIDLATLTGRMRPSQTTRRLPPICTAATTPTLFWAESIRRDPGARVLPNPGRNRGSSPAPDPPRPQRECFACLAGG